MTKHDYKKATAVLDAFMLSSSIEVKTTEDLAREYETIRHALLLADKRVRQQFAGYSISTPDYGSIIVAGEESASSALQWAKKISAYPDKVSKFEAGVFKEESGRVVWVPNEAMIQQAVAELEEFPLSNSKSTIAEEREIG